MVYQKEKNCSTLINKKPDQVNSLLEKYMVNFNALIKKFGDKSEKTGWTYIEIPAAIAKQKE